jgi:hypothetical protein
MLKPASRSAMARKVARLPAPMMATVGFLRVFSFLGIGSLVIDIATE